MTVFVVVTEYHNTDSTVDVFASRELAYNFMRQQVEWFCSEAGWHKEDVLGSPEVGWITVGCEGDAIALYEAEVQS